MAKIHWSEAQGQGYGVMDLTAGCGARRHDMCIVILRGQEAENATWDSTMAKERLAAIAAQVAPQHEVLQRALESAEVCFDWAIYRQPFLASWISPKERVVLLGDAAHATAPFMGQAHQRLLLESTSRR